MAKKLNETTPENMFVEEKMKRRHRIKDKSWEAIGARDYIMLKRDKEGIKL